MVKLTISCRCCRHICRCNNWYLTLDRDKTRWHRSKWYQKHRIWARCWRDRTEITCALIDRLRVANRLRSKRCYCTGGSCLLWRWNLIGNKMISGHGWIRCGTTTRTGRGFCSLSGYQETTNLWMRWSCRICQNRVCRSLWWCGWCYCIRCGLHTLYLANRWFRYLRGPNCHTGTR